MFKCATSTIASNQGELQQTQVCEGICDEGFDGNITTTCLPGGVFSAVEGSCALDAEDDDEDDRSHGELSTSCLRFGMLCLGRASVEACK